MADESLRKTLIIRSRNDFEKLFQTGRRVSGQYVFINYLPLQGSDVFKAGFVCGKKVGNAVTRNLYKRRMRDIVRKNKTCFQGLEFILVAQPAVLKSDFQSLRQDILDTIQKVRR